MLLQAKCQNIYHSNGVVALSKLCIVIAMLLAVLRSASRTMQVSGTMVQTHFPSTCGHTILWLSTLHLLQVASLLSSCFFLSCFPCLTLATSTASSAWQQLEESTRVFKSSPVILQLQLPRFQFGSAGLVLACSRCVQSWCVPCSEVGICGDGQALQVDWQLKASNIAHP